MTPEALAQLFHETYERLAPSYQYETRRASAVPWVEVPEPNRSLMVAVAAEVLATLTSPTEHDSACPDGHPECDGHPLTCLVRESEALGLYDDPPAEGDDE